jgi:hypothetical protein
MGSTTGAVLKDGRCLARDKHFQVTGGNVFGAKGRNRIDARPLAGARALL